MWKRLRDWLSVVADFLQVAGYFGWTPAAVVSLLAIIFGWLGQVAIFWIVIAPPIAFAATLVLTQRFAPRIGMISLSEGARVAYEQLRGTLWAEASERLRVNGTPEGILDYLATRLIAEIPVFGKYPPSTKLEKIEPRVLKSGSVEGGATFLELSDQHRTRIIELTVRRSELRNAIKHMRESTSAFSR